MKKLKTRTRTLDRTLRWSLIGLGGCMLSLSVVAPAKADLFSKDLLNANDGLVTRDTRTGLEWLDYTASKDLSYAQIIQGEKDLTTKLGFRYASLNEIQEFVKSADLYGRTTPDFFPAATATRDVGISPDAYAGKALTSFLGIPGSRLGSSFGGTTIYFDTLKYGQPDPVSQKLPVFGISYSESSGTIIDPASPIKSTFGASTFPYGIRDFGTGPAPGGGSASFLVRDIRVTPPNPQSVPEPSNLILLLGTAGLIITSYKKHDRKLKPEM